MKYIILPERLSHSPAFSVKPAPVTTLWYMLQEIPDPRRAQGTRHPLPVLLMLAILAICSGESSYEAMQDWARNYQDKLVKQVPFIARHQPDASTFQRVFSRLDISCLEEVLSSWIQDVVPLEEGEGIALDGKSVGKSGYHLVAAFAHKARTVLFQEGSKSKGKELVAAPKVLKNIPLAGKLVTADALFAQTNICKLITKQGGGFVFTVKDNQKTLAEDIRLYFNQPPWGAEIDRHKTVDKQKGRVEVRQMEVTSQLNSHIDWPGVTHVWRVTRKRTEKGETTTQTAVGIARLLEAETAAKQINQLVRGHWQIENRLFRQRDVVFNEDKSTIRKNNAPQIKAGLHNLVTSIFHRAAVRSFKKAQRRFAAKPQELFEFLGLPQHARAYATINYR